MKSVRSLGVCSTFQTRFPTKKALKRQFLKLRNLHCRDRDPACIEWGKEVFCPSLGPHELLCTASADVVGQPMEGGHGRTWCGLESLSSCPEPASLSLWDINLEGSSEEGLPSPSQVRLCGRALPGTRTGTSQCLAGSAFQGPAAGGSQPGLHFLGLVVFPGSPQTDLVIYSWKQRFGAVGTAVGCPSE